jgi:hypothetical protein
MVVSHRFGLVVYHNVAVSIASGGWGEGMRIKMGKICSIVVQSVEFP